MKQKTTMIFIFLGCLTLPVIFTNEVHAKETSKPHTSKHTVCSVKKYFLNNEETIKQLKFLAHYEIDHYFLLEYATHHIEDKLIKQQLNAFKKDVKNNIKKLSFMIRALGEEPPENTRDFKGFFMEGYSAIRGMFGDYGVLKATKNNEKLILNAYHEVMKKPIHDCIKIELQEIYDKNITIYGYVKQQAQKMED